MPFIISAGTNVNGFGVGIQSVNLNISPQIQRLYQLGTTVPFDRNQILQKNLSITRYAGGGGTYDTTASTSCDEPAPLSISIDAAGCSNSISVSDDWWVTSYSYQKDVQGWGIESWSLVSRPTIIGSNDVEARMIRGTAEGQSTSNGGADTGVIFLTGIITGETLEVSAGQPGIGKSFSINFGEVSTVGNGTGKADGKEGNASVSIPYTPIYLSL